MIDREKFFAQFAFNQSGAGLVGVEREQFIISPGTKSVVPLALQYLQRIRSLKKSLRHSKFSFGYELSACQLESKIGPCQLHKIGDWLRRCEAFLQQIDMFLALSRADIEVAPEEMPLDIYPDPTGRYQVITQNMPRNVLSAACRVAATHIHVGMPNLLTAIETYNKVIDYTDDLMLCGDSSSGRRMSLYSVMANHYRPEPIASADEFFRQAQLFKYDQDPRKCWTLVRISIHGTLEFRMFGATSSIDRIVEWAARCHRLCF